MEPIDLEVLDNETRDVIATSGLQFMRTITEAYGAERGLELWTTIVDTLGPGLKGEIFFRMITGNSESSVTVMSSNVKNTTNLFVGYIKAVRTYTGWGLKEAKDFCDATESGRRMILPVSMSQRQKCVTELLGFGVKAL